MCTGGREFRTRRTRRRREAGADTYVGASRRRWQLLTLTILTVGIVVGLGVLLQEDFRGGSSPQEVAMRYVAAVLRGDRVTLFLLTHPTASLPEPLDARIEKYRGVAPDRVAIAYERDSIAAYLMTAVIRIDGVTSDELVLQNKARRWYIVRLVD